MADSRQLLNPECLEKTKKTFNEFIQKYKSSEDYYPREKYPHLTLAGLDALADHPDVDQIIEAFLIRSTRLLIWKKLHHDLMDERSGLLGKQKGQPVCVNALQAFPVALTGHGECSNLAYALVNELIGGSIPQIEIQVHFAAKDIDHCMVVVHPENGEPYVFDPFFKIQGTMSAYLQSEKYLNYFRKLTGNANWCHSNLADLKVEQYDFSDYSKKIVSMQADIQILKEHINVKPMAQLIKQVASMRDESKVRKLHFLLILLEKILYLYDSEGVSKEDFEKCFRSFREKIVRKYPLPEKESFFSEMAQYKKQDQIKDFMDHIKQENYGAALRTACTSQHHGMALVQRMQQYPKLILLSDLISEKNKTGTTAFHIAASKGNVK